jgi:hypothetical protein
MYSFTEINTSRRPLTEDEKNALIAYLDARETCHDRIQCTAAAIFLALVVEGICIGDTNPKLCTGLFAAAIVFALFCYLLEMVFPGFWKGPFGVDAASQDRFIDHYRNAHPENYGSIHLQIVQ